MTKADLIAKISDETGLERNEVSRTRDQRTSAEFRRRDEEGRSGEIRNRA